MRSRKNKVKHYLSEHKFCLAVMVVFVLQAINGNYQIEALSWIRQITIMLFLTFGVSLEMMCGDFDLAFAAQISVSTVAAAFLIVNGLPIAAACFVILLLNILLGCLKGLLISGLGMPSLIMTLALQVILLNIFSSFFQDDSISFSAIYRYAGNGSLEIVFLILLFISIGAVYFFLNGTYYGKYCRVLGENAALARKSGLNCMAISVIIHAFAALFLTLATIEILLYTSAGSSYMGSNYLYKVLAAAVLGGSGYQNGRGTVSGMIIGGITMVLMLLMLTSKGYLNRMETIIEGCIILLALWGNKKRTEDTLPNSENHHIE